MSWFSVAYEFLVLRSSRYEDNRFGERQKEEYTGEQDTDNIHKGQATCESHADTKPNWTSITHKRRPVEDESGLHSLLILTQFPNICPELRNTRMKSRMEPLIQLFASMISQHLGKLLESKH
jgi:hypothetical protein